MKSALVLVHEPGGPACQVEHRLVERGFEVHTHLITNDMDEPNKAAPFPDFGAYDLIVPMGSVRSLTNKAEIDTWIDVEIELIRAAHEGGTPILGVCFGGQLLAEALGGSVEPAPVTEIGWFKIEAVDGEANPVGPGPWLEWHHDRFVPPPEAQHLARTDDAPQLFRIGQSVGTQFHPEIDVAHVDKWLSFASDDYLNELGVGRDEFLAEARSNEAANIEQCHRLVDWFLDDVAFPVNP